MKISIETFTYKKVYICVILNLVYILSECGSEEVIYIYIIITFKLP